MDINVILLFIIMLWSGIYAISYGIYVWQKKNYIGSIMIYLLVFTASSLIGYVALR